MKRDRTKEPLLEQLKKMPIVQIACERAGVGRSTYYRWREEDGNFRKAADEAIAEGEALITDMSESQLITLIRDKHFPAVQLWLRQHHQKYATRVELTGHIAHLSQELTNEEKQLVEKALRLAMPRQKDQTDG